MLSRARVYNPVSSSYREVYGPDLGLRTHPYTFKMPDAETLALVEEDSDEPLDLKLHTLQSRWLCAEGTLRFEEWSAGQDDGVEIVAAGTTELKARIRAWRAVAADTRWTNLARQLREVYLDWGAKRAVWLAEELDVRQKGCKVYAAASSDLPPQVLSRTNQEYLDNMSA